MTFKVVGSLQSVWHNRADRQALDHAPTQRGDRSLADGDDLSDVHIEVVGGLAGCAQRIGDDLLS